MYRINHRLLPMRPLLVGVMVLMGLATAVAAEPDLDTPVDIFFVWVGDRPTAPIEPQAPEPVEPAPQPDPEPVATLDLDTLETRLRKTKAIGMFTKLELKNQVGALLKDFEGFHDSNSQLSLEQLEERFDLLVMKLLLLLQDDDPELHHEIADARPALWATLSSPERFAEVNGP